MKRIIASALFTAHITSALAGQAGAIEKAQVDQFTLPTLNQENIKQDWQPDFKKLIESGLMKPNQLLVKFKASAIQPSAVFDGFADFKSVRDIFTPAVNLANLKEKITSWKLVTFENGDAIANKFIALQNDPNVEYVAPNLRLKVQGASNDMGAELWGLNNTGATVEFQGANGETYSFETTADVDIDAPEAWDIRSDASDVVVAVIDTGVDYTHPELSNNLWTNPGEIAGNGIDDDGNGYVDDVHGYDFAYRDSDPSDVYGHGTHCAGTIAAEGNNSEGITGVAWSAQLMSVKVLNDAGWGYTSDIIEGILYAADNGAEVSNNSYGMLIWDAVYAEMALQPYADAIQAAAESGMVFAAAAGNDGVNLDEELFTVPASLNLPNVISVAAIDPNGEFAGFSNTGFHHTDIAAPGVAIKSTIPGNQYDFYNGTSMATPHVAGVAALMKAEAPQISAADIKSIIINTADTRSQQAGLVRSNGILNARKALEALSAGCDSFEATNSQHESAGRAYSETTTEGGTCWGSFCWGGTTVTTWYAQGSDENLGTNGSTMVTLTEKSAGFFVTDGSCDSSLDLPPSITLEGRVEDYLAVGDLYTAPGYTATDAEDGDLTSAVQVHNNVDTSVVGNYLVKYEVEDSKGNKVVETRLIHVLEESVARIFLEDPICTFMGPCQPMTTVVNQTFSEPGYFAYDVLDGDLTHMVVSEGEILENLDVIGNRGPVWYSVTDLDGERFEASVYRAVYVVDANNPLIVIEQGEEYYHTFKTYRRDTGSVHPGGEHPEYNAYSPYAIDHVDGVLHEENCTIDNPVDYSVAGDYLVSFTVTDSEGYTDQVYSLVQVIEDDTPPEMSIYCDEHTFVEVNSDWEASKFCVVAGDELDPYPTREFVSNVDITTPGDYEVIYTVADYAGNSDTWTMTVTVVDGTTPSLTSMVAEGGPRSLTISGTAFDPDNNIEKIEVLVHGVEGWDDWVEIDGAEEWSVTLNDIDPDQYGYTARARVTDSTGLVSNPYSGIGTIHDIHVWDSKVETAQAIVDGNNILVSGTASDANGDLDHVVLSVTIDDVLYQFVAEGTYNWSYQFENMDKGEYEISIYAIDAQNHWSKREVVTAKVGYNPPTIDFYEVAGGELSVTVTGNASDVDGDLSRVLIGIGDSTEWHVANGTENFSLTVTGVEAGNQQVRIWALDSEDLGVVEVTTVDVLPASCEDFSATLAEHESAGRAYSETTTEGETCYGTFCFGGTEVTRWYAVGSGEELGTNASTVVTLKEDTAGSGNYIQGTCPVDPQPPVIESYEISELNYNRAVVTGIASDVNDDIDRVVLGLGAVTGILCEGTTSFTCILDYSVHDIAVGAPFGVTLVAYDSLDAASNPESFTITRPDEPQEVCFTDTNANHEAAGRAYLQYNVLYYANGSDAYLGQAADVTSLEQQGQPGNWVKVSSCQ